MSDKRKRVRVPIDVSPEALAMIDSARGSLSRNEFCRQRIFLSSGFGDPTYDVCARLLGTADALDADRWSSLLVLADVVRQTSDLVAQRRCASPENVSQLTQQVHSLAGSMLAEADRQAQLIGELLSLAREFSLMIAKRAEQDGSPSSWQRKKR